VYSNCFHHKIAHCNVGSILASLLITNPFTISHHG